MAHPKEDRPAGRSFDDPSRPLGAELLEQSEESSPTDTTVYGRAARGAPYNVVAERAKAVAVLRKAEELMRTGNPAPTSAVETRRALELAAGRVGLTLREYEDVVRGDPALVELERRVIADAIARIRR